MKQFVVIYRVPVETMAEWKKNTSPEEMKKQGEELGKKMMVWMQKQEGAFVQKGWPLGKNTRMNSQGAKPETNDLNYICVMQAESIDDIIAMFKDNPHMEIPTSFLDIMEVPHMGLS